jgi:hypothetical protein
MEIRRKIHTKTGSAVALLLAIIFVNDAHGHCLPREQNRIRFFIKTTKLQAFKLKLKTVCLRTDCVNGLMLEWKIDTFR